jgi:hypothetical protein
LLNVASIGKKYMLHPFNKQLLYSFIRNGAKTKERVMHPQPLIEQLDEFNLLAETDSTYFINHEQLITIRQGEEDHFFVYLFVDDGYCLEYLNENKSEPIFVQTQSVRDLVFSAQDYVLNKENEQDEIKKKKSIQDIFLFFKLLIS